MIPTQHTDEFMTALRTDVGSQFLHVTREINIVIKQGLGEVGVPRTSACFDKKFRVFVESNAEPVQVISKLGTIFAITTVDQ
jgi:hypothetical protein